MHKLILPFFFLISFFSDSQDLEYVWSSVIGDSTSNLAVHPNGVFIDNHNNKFICGFFSGTHDFDPGPGVHQMSAITNTQASTIYVVKLDSLNNFVWANSYGTTGSIWNYGFVVDSAGSVYTYGYYQGYLDYDPQNSTGYVTSEWWYYDSYMHKLDPNGHFEWIKSWGSNATDGIQKIQMDEDQNFYALGFYSDSTDVDPGPGNYMLHESTPGGNGYYIAKFDPDFNLLWAKQYESPGVIQPLQMTLDAADEITVTGRYLGVMDFDMGAGTDSDTAYYYDMFTHVMDRSGNHKWHHSIEGPDIEMNGACAVDSQKNRYILGSFQSTMDFNPGGVPSVIEFTPQSPNYSDSYILKLDSLGNQVWTKAIQGMGNNEAQGLKMESDQLIVFGQVDSRTDIDPNSGLIMIAPPYMVNSLVFIEKLDSNANVLWHEEFLCSSTFYINGFEIDQNNDYFIMGYLSGHVDIDPGPNVVQLTHNLSNTATYLAILGELPCSRLGSNFSSLTNATCSTPGGVTASGVYGAPPYNYTWLTNPPSNGPGLVTDTCGLYFVKTTDASGCVDTNSVYINGPVSGSTIDLDVNLVTSTFVQGQPATLWLDAYNSGCQQTTGIVMLVLDSLTQYDSSSVAPTNIIGDTLLWDLAYGTSDSVHFMATIFVTTSQAAITGDTVCFQVQASPFSGDSDTLNNEKTYCEPILASYDPNDKKVFPQGLCDDHVYMGEDLTYTVRFQNTGNSEAINVNIIDMMDPDLDLTTFEVLAKSHPGLSVNHMGGRELQFNFENIHLPDSASDPEGSNGYIIFKISPREGMAVNSVVSNEVNIYFDFNAPILTNTATTTFTNDIPCIHTDDLNLFEIEQSSFTVYPNPTDNTITFKVRDNQTHPLNVYSSIGELLFCKVITDGSVVSLKDLPDGLYFLNLEGYESVKVIKR